MSHSEHHEEEQDDFSFKKFFVPLTTFKAIHIIAIVGFVVFSNMLFNGFVWDDKTYIILNPEVHNFNISKIFGFNLFNQGAEYRAFTVFYFNTLYFFFKNAPFFYHFLQLTLHIVNAILVFYLFSKYFSKKLALFFSLIFLVHPIMVESVSYIGASGTPLFFLFGLVALIFSIKPELSIRRNILIDCLLLLCLLTRETGLLFLLIIIVHRFIFKQKINILFISGGFVTLIVYFLMRFSAGVFFKSYDYGYIPILNLTFWERVQNIPAIVFYYIKTFFYPRDLAIEQNWIVTSLNLSNFYLPLSVLFLVTILLGLLGVHVYKINRKNFKIYLFFLLWLLIGLLFHIQIFPLNMTVADRWFYFPIVGLLGVISIGFSQINVKKEKLKQLSIILFVAFIVILSFRTVVRNDNWKNAITLYEHDRKIHTNFDLENNLGAEYKFIKKYDKSIEHFNKSIELFPFEGNLNNLAGTYKSMGNWAMAKEYSYKALNAKIFGIPPKHSRATYENLGFVLLASEEYEDAKKIIKTGLTQYPDARNLLLQLAIAEYNLQNQKAALNTAKKVRSLYQDEMAEYIYTQIINNKPILLEP